MLMFNLIVTSKLYFEEKCLMFSQHELLQSQDTDFLMDLKNILNRTIESSPFHFLIQKNKPVNLSLITYFKLKRKYSQRKTSTNMMRAERKISYTLIINYTGRIRLLLISLYLSFLTRAKSYLSYKNPLIKFLFFFPPVNTSHFKLPTGRAHYFLPALCSYFVSTAIFCRIYLYFPFP